MTDEVPPPPENDEGHPVTVTSDEYRARRTAEEIEKAARSLLIWYGDRPTEPPAYLVNETLPEVGVAVLAGQFGAAKTFVGANLSAAIIVAGGEFAGEAVNRKGGVLWLAAEGEREIQRRVEAAIAARGGDANARQPFARQAMAVPRLTDKDALDRLRVLVRAAAEHMRAKFDCELVIVVIDTLSSAAEFDDENNPAQPQKVMNILAALAGEMKMLVVVVDHHGKVVETGIRGSSVKGASADAILACLGDKDPNTGAITHNRRLVVSKLRDGPTGRIIPFKLAPTIDGSTCTVKWAEDVEPVPDKPPGRTWPKSLTIFKSALDAMLSEVGKMTVPRAGANAVKAVDREAVRTEFLRLYVADTPKAKSVAFIRCAKDAIERGIMCSIATGPDLGQTIFWLPMDDSAAPSP
jgi:hypothetical protein